MNNSNDNGPKAFSRTYKSVHGNNSSNNSRNNNYNNNNSNSYNNGNYSNSNSNYNNGSNSNSNYNNGNGSNYNNGSSSNYNSSRIIKKKPLTIRNVYIEKTSEYIMPAKASRGSIGYDLFSVESVVIAPQTAVLVNTGLKMAVPVGYEMQIRSRSGLCINSCVGVLNSPATIDWDYRGEIKVILYNFGKESFTVNKGDRIAQAVFAPVIMVRFNEVDQLNTPNSNRGEKGFGASGTEGESNYGDNIEINLTEEEPEAFTTECNM